MNRLMMKDSMCQQYIRWYKNGDHPLDECVLVSSENCEPYISEGKVVRRFNHPNVDSNGTCPNCGLIIKAHGWIDCGHNGIMVCPGDLVSVLKVGFYDDSHQIQNSYIKIGVCGRDK